VKLEALTVGLTAGSREVPGRKPVTRDNDNDDNHNIDSHLSAVFLQDSLNIMYPKKILLWDIFYKYRLLLLIYSIYPI
jgi:hypothetical protein